MPGSTTGSLTHEDNAITSSLSLYVREAKSHHMPREMPGYGAVYDSTKAHLASALYQPQSVDKARGEQIPGGTDMSSTTSQMPSGMTKENWPSQSQCSLSGSTIRPSTGLRFTDRSPHLQQQGMPLQSVAMATLQHLPYPLMVLDNRKALVMANNAMGRLLEIEHHEDVSPVEKLWGKTLSELGIDVLQNGRPTWITWNSFLDSIAREQGTEAELQKSTDATGGDTMPPPKYKIQTGDITNTAVGDTAVEVLISPAVISASYSEDRGLKAAPLRHTYAKLIITVWELDDERYFTLTFTNTEASCEPSGSGFLGVKQSQKLFADSARTPSQASQYGCAATTLAHTSLHMKQTDASEIINPTSLFTSESPFPPLGVPSPIHLQSTSSSLQRLFVMKDALLDSTEMPILAMWKDFGLTISNKATRQMFPSDADISHSKNGYDLIKRWHAWDETFTAPLRTEEYPITELIRTEKPFSSRKLGVKDGAGRKRIFDFAGEAIRDEITGEFLAGMVTARNITDMTEEMKEMRDMNERRFQLICNSMPQMIWTSTADGLAEWFSERW